MVDFEPLRPLRVWVKTPHLNQFRLWSFYKQGESFCEGELVVVSLTNSMQSIKLPYNYHIIASPHACFHICLSTICSAATSIIACSCKERRGRGGLCVEGKTQRRGVKGGQAGGGARREEGGRRKEGAVKAELWCRQRITWAGICLQTESWRREVERGETRKKRGGEWMREENTGEERRAWIWINISRIVFLCFIPPCAVCSEQEGRGRDEELPSTGTPLRLPACLAAWLAGCAAGEPIHVLPFVSP